MTPFHEFGIVAFAVSIAGMPWIDLLQASEGLEGRVVCACLAPKTASAGTKDGHWCSAEMEDITRLIRLAEEISVDACMDMSLLEQRRKYLEEATSRVDRILRKDDLSFMFGRVVVMKVRIELLRGNVVKAQELVKVHLPRLTEIHEKLQAEDPEGMLGYVRRSPLPECRYLVANMLWEKAKIEMKAENPNDTNFLTLILGEKVNGRRSGLGAFNHAVNVYIKYPDSDYAEKARRLSEEIDTFVFGRYKKRMHIVNPVVYY